MDAESVLLVGAVIASGLVAGLLYGWQVSVIPGTRRVVDGTYVETMQHINRAIINPAFIGPFMGVPVVSAVAAAVAWAAGERVQGWLLAAAAAVYAVGVLGVTVAGNVPLNDELDRFDAAGATDDGRRQQRRRYEAGWNRWHAVRTVASVAAFALAIGACIA